MVLSQELLPGIAGDLAEVVVDIGDVSGKIGGADDGVEIRHIGKLLDEGLSVQCGSRGLCRGEMSWFGMKLRGVRKAPPLPRFLSERGAGCHSFPLDDRVVPEVVDLFMRTLPVAGKKQIF